MLTKETKLIGKPFGMSNDVWFRKFLKPLIGQKKNVTYKQAFQQRIVQTKGIPVIEASKGFHELFKDEYRMYSPLQGMLFAHNNFIDNLYRYGDENEELVQLIHELFHVLPGGEIQVTHVGRKTGAHFTASIIGDILAAWEDWKQNDQDASAELQRKLADNLTDLVEEHKDFRHNCQALHEEVGKARQGLAALEKQEEDAASVREEIKHLEGDIIKPARRDAKKLRKQAKKAKDAEEKASLEKEAEGKEKLVEATEEQVAQLRKHIVPSLEFKTARKALKRAEDAVVLEREDRSKTLALLVRCMIRYDLKARSYSVLPFYSTTAVLLAYMWRKYDSLSSLEGYFSAMEQFGALTASMETVIKIINSDNEEIPSIPTRRRNWSEEDVAIAAAITSGKPNSVNRPTVIPFSYITWAAYSEFPDCGETALRNLMNQIVFNSSTGKFDHMTLQEMRDTTYPDMSTKLINFYEKYNDPHSSTDADVAVEWINVVSELNNDPSRSEQVRYRREKEQKNIASPLKNLLRVINALFGLQDLNRVESLHEIVNAINKIRDTNMKIDTDGIKPDGFGTLKFTADDVSYELQSYKPVHFGFVQTVAAQNKASRQNYLAFRNLMLESCSTSGDSSMDLTDLQFFEKLALASLFVPYQIQRNKPKRLFRELPAHFVLLFADLDTLAQKEAAKTFLTDNNFASEKSNNELLQKYLDNIDSYTPPTFAPPSQKKEQDAE